MGKIRSSSSKRIHVEEEYQEEEDLSQTHMAKFLILSYEEGAKLTTIKFREIVGYKYIPNSLLNDVGIHDSFEKMLTICGLKKYVSMLENTYVDLIT